AHLAHQQPAAHARGDRAAAEQPGTARCDEPPPAGAAVAAKCRGRPVGGGHYVLRCGPGRLPRQRLARGRREPAARAGGGDLDPADRVRRVARHPPSAQQSDGDRSLKPMATNVWQWIAVAALSLGCATAQAQGSDYLDELTSPAV